MSVTKKDIADYLGISRTAVSLVLNNTPSSTISKETRERILKAAQELGYRNREASPPTLCFLLYNREADDPRYMEDLRIAEEISALHGYRLLFMNIKESPDDFQRLKQFLGAREAEGILATGDMDDAFIDMVVESGIPSIFYAGEEREGVNTAIWDHRKAARKAIRYLIELGHQRIALFTGRLDLPVHLAGLEGYKQALEEAGIPLDASLIQVSREEDGYELATRMEMLQIPYTAAFCVNTVIQFGVLQRLKEKGIAVPGEISLMGYGFSELVRASTPKLTTLKMDSNLKHSVVVRLLDIIKNQITEKETMYLAEFEMHEGETVGICRNLAE